MNKNFKLKKDIIIKAGTVFEHIPVGSKTEYGIGNYWNVFGLTKDTFGTVVYAVDEDDPEIFKWFEEV